MLLNQLPRRSIFFYSGANLDLRKSLQTYQNKCLRTIYGKKLWPGTTIAHQDNGLLTVRARQYLHLLKYAHVKSHFRGNLKPHQGRLLRSNRKILLLEHRVRHVKYGKSFVHIATKGWNTLSEDLKKINDTMSFITRVKSELWQNKLNFPE